MCVGLSEMKNLWDTIGRNLNLSIQEEHQKTPNGEVYVQSQHSRMKSVLMVPMEPQSKI